MLVGWIRYGFGWLGWALARLRRRLRRPSPWVAFLVESPPPELPAPAGPRWQRVVGLGRPPLSLRELRRQLLQVAAEPRVQGAVIHIRPMELTAGQVDALREVIAEFRAAGKRAACWASSYTGATYAVACAADQVLVQPGGGVGPLGVARQYTFLADALRWAGIEADFVQISPYKTAADTLTRSGFTPEAREMADWLADAAYAEQVTFLGRDRGLDAGAARALIDRSPFTDAQALEAGAVDGVVDEEELPARLGGAVQPWQDARRGLMPRRPRRPGRALGLIRVEGMIVDGRSRRPPPLPPLPLPLVTAEQSGDLTVVRQARRLAADRRVAAVVLWIDSGGGSATASEAMAAALRALAGQKPLVAAMGSVAASGGYYVATPAQRVLAQPGTVTGSIGVLAGKLALGGLLERLLLNWQVVARGEHAAMYAPVQPFREDERSRLRGAIERSYELFLERVAAGRSSTPAQVDPIAGGRVWTGRQALERGLVDALGGFEKAVAEACRLGGIEEADPAIREAGGGRDVAPVARGAAGALEHALALVTSLNRAWAWYLSPFI
ncbi:MAG: signal peptide peptidase SppA [Candidatus Dormibacteraeota bacterium]|nr:signal peptide peptidase SppA [Candidatus Dormibacteraeota bacterium]